MKKKREENVCVMRTLTSDVAHGEKKISWNPCIVMWMFHISLDLQLHARGSWHISTCLVFLLSSLTPSPGTTALIVSGLTPQTEGRGPCQSLGYSWSCFKKKRGEEYYTLFYCGKVWFKWSPSRRCHSLRQRDIFGPWNQKEIKNLCFI